MSTDLIKQLPNIDLYSVIVVPVRYLHEAEYNPRTIDEAGLDALKISLQQNPDFLKARPTIVNAAPGREGVVIGGNQRVRAAVELGWDKIPVMFVLAETAEKEKAWNILDNKNAGAWDTVKLQSVIGDLHGAGYDLTGIGYTPIELTGILSMAPTDPTETDEYKKNGTTPGGKWVQCPECSHQFKVTKKVKIPDPEAEQPAAQ